MSKQYENSLPKKTLVVSSSDMSKNINLAMDTASIFSPTLEEKIMLKGGVVVGEGGENSSIHEEKRVKIDEEEEVDNNESIGERIIRKLYEQWEEEGMSLGLPCGYRFSPSDLELVEHYLLNKILGNSLSSDVIKEIAIYEYDANELPIDEFKCGKKQEAYYFTNLERKYPKGQLPNRTTKSGYWKATGNDMTVKSNNQVVGFKKILVFHSGKAPNGEKTCWVMHEFRVNLDTIPVDTYDDSIMAKMERCVLCRILKKKESDKKQKIENDQQSSESD